jgi:hypothetical protein
MKQNNISVPKILYEKWTNNEKEIQKQRKEARQNPDSKEVEKMVSMEQLKELKNDYEKTLTDQYQPVKDIRYLILSLYTNDELPPLRSQDWYNAKVFDNKNDMDAESNQEEHNYVCLDESLFIRNVGKTTKKNGRRFITLPNDLIETIRTFKNKSGSEWLLPKTNNINKHIEQSHFTRLFQRMIEQKYGKEKKVSSSMMRKIVVSKKIKDIETAYPDFFKVYSQLHHLAKDMGHSPYIQQSIYGRLAKVV